VLKFDALRDTRKAIREFSVRHVASIEAFRDADRPWFKVELDEPDRGSERVQHRTTAATCLESLEDAGSPAGQKLIRKIATEFAERVLDESFDNWKSDGAAFVYCRVRTLPAVLHFAPDVALARAERVQEHVSFVWRNVSLESENQAVREAAKKPGAEEQPLTPDNAEEVLENAYPPNAFHTHWALKTLAACRSLEKPELFVDPFHDKSRIAGLWCQNMLSAQVALHAAGSDEADPNQLAWALISQFVEINPPASLAAGERSREAIYRAALDAFFDQQLPSGRWPLGQPLFHYPRAGNAYCYTFETLAGLLEPALRDSRDGQLLRELLKPHLPRLLAAWDALLTSARPLDTSGSTLVGWSSGHHPHRTDPEGWASASAFSFVQRLRRLLGTYTREVAAAELGVRPSKYLGEEAGGNKLAERGSTWTNANHWTAGEQLAALFLHPIQSRHIPLATIDPDRALIADGQARSAILFGPPGTSKTTLAEALAGSIQWDFLEVHASQFLAEGMDKVPSSADAIFARLMELDRCVVLFDEIDELLRDRQGENSDPFGRFLTTSMLPKVATLWEQGRLIFFVATNDIARADPAIKRSQRFDSAIFVAPPSFDAKIAALSLKMPSADLSWLSKADVERALEDGDALGYFALLRFDQADELVDLLEGTASDVDAMRSALAEMGDRLKTTDWQGRDEAGHPLDPFEMFKAMVRNETRDHRMVRFVCVEGAPVPNAAYEEVPKPPGSSAITYLRLLGRSMRPPESIETDEGRRFPDPVLRYR
jgi:hypothetical protein